MLDCIPLHDFVGSSKTFMLAAVTDYNKDCVLVEGRHMTGTTSIVHNIHIFLLQGCVSI